MFEWVEYQEQYSNDQSLKKSECGCPSASDKQKEDNIVSKPHPLIFLSHPLPIEEQIRINSATLVGSVM